MNNQYAEPGRGRHAMRWLLGFFSLVVLAASCQRQVKETPEEEPLMGGIDSASGLIIDTGFVMVRQTCQACHSAKLVTQNAATREGWQAMIRWMQERHKLWDLGANEDIILDYLAKHYAPKYEGRRAPLTNIQWYELEQ